MSKNSDTDEITIEEIMSAPVVTLKTTSVVLEAVSKMDNYNISGVVVVDSSDKPVGFVTERDILTRVVAKKLDPSRMTLADVMSSPMHTIDCTKSVMKALDSMRLRKIKRLGVLRDGVLVGIITERDILTAVPVIYEKLLQKINTAPQLTIRPEHTEGYCEECGQWSEMLMLMEGEYLCDNCRSESEKAPGEAS
jgi:signal-transduction protein with cAMP-binding, CBS, and nucleotidyltransferase domain